MFDDFTLAQHGEPDFAALKTCADELIAYCRAPLPPGDAGLFEAERRMQEIEAAAAEFTPAGTPYKIATRIEKITDPLFAAAHDALVTVVDRRPPQSLAGVVVKLRHLLRGDPDCRCLRGILALVEREAQRA